MFGHELAKLCPDGDWYRAELWRKEPLCSDPRYAAEVPLALEHLSRLATPAWMAEQLRAKSEHLLLLWLDSPNYFCFWDAFQLGRDLRTLGDNVPPDLRLRLLQTKEFFRAAFEISLGAMLHRQSRSFE